MGVGMDEVASLSKVALSFLGVGDAEFSFIGALLVAGGVELLGSVGELAPGTIGAYAMKCVVFAEGGFVLSMLFVAFGGDIRILSFFVIGRDV